MQSLFNLAQWFYKGFAECTKCIKRRLHLIVNMSSLIYILLVSWSTSMISFKFLWMGYEATHKSFDFYRINPALPLYWSTTKSRAAAWTWEASSDHPSLRIEYVRALVEQNRWKEAQSEIHQIEEKSNMLYICMLAIIVDKEIDWSHRHCERRS